MVLQSITDTEMELNLLDRIDIIVYHILNLVDHSKSSSAKDIKGVELLLESSILKKLWDERLILLILLYRR